MARNFTCKFCGKELSNIVGLKNHQNLSRNCRQQLEELLRSFSFDPGETRPRNRANQGQHEAINENLAKPFHSEHDLPSQYNIESGNIEEGAVNVDKRARVEDAPDEDDSTRHIEPCPGSLGAGVPIGRKKMKTDFEDMRDERLAHGGDDPIWNPFIDREEWDLATWLVRSVGQNSTEEFLKLPIVSSISKFTAKPKSSLAGR